MGEAGIEPTTPGLEGRCSIQLSYSPAVAALRGVASSHCNGRRSPQNRLPGAACRESIRSATGSVERNAEPLRTAPHRAANHQIHPSVRPWHRPQPLDDAPNPRLMPLERTKEDCIARNHVDPARHPNPSFRRHAIELQRIDLLCRQRPHIAFRCEHRRVRPFNSRSTSCTTALSTASAIDPIFSGRFHRSTNPAQSTSMKPRFRPTSAAQSASMR